METRVSELIRSGDNKDKVVSEITDNENLIFLWKVAADMYVIWNIAIETSSRSSRAVVCRKRIFYY